MLSWIFPVTCVLCGESAKHAICPACREKLLRVPRPICLYCGTPVAGDQLDPYTCHQCKSAARHFAFARSALMQEEHSLRLVHDLKYHRANYLAPAFAVLMSELWETTPQLRAHPDWHLVPVPISREHLNRRGYNQAAELAHCLSRTLHLPVLDIMERLPTGIPSQTRLSAGERRRHAMRAYGIQKSYRDQPLAPHLLLVDDVYTTGSTAQSCAKQLLQLPGVQQVGVITLLRAGLFPGANPPDPLH